MPEGYERSRAKFTENYDDDRGYAPPPGGRGGGQRQRLLQILVGVAAVVVLVLVIVLVKNILSPGSKDTNGSPTDQVSTSASPLPTDTADATVTGSPEDTATPADTATIAPEDTSSAAPDDSSQPDDTSSAQPDDTVSANPTTSPKATSSAKATTSAKATATPKATSSTSGGDTAKALTPTEIKGTAKVTDYLSLRASASSSGSLVVKIPKDGEVVVLAVSSADTTWLKVKYSDKTGYVPAKYIDLGSDVKVATVKSTTVNIRDGAGTSKKLIGTLKSGDTVIVESTTKVSGVTWLKLKIGSTTGYASATYFRVES